MDEGGGYAARIRPDVVEALMQVERGEDGRLTPVHAGLVLNSTDAERAEAGRRNAELASRLSEVLGLRPLTVTQLSRGEVSMVAAAYGILHRHWAIDRHLSLGDLLKVVPSEVKDRATFFLHMAWPEIEGPDTITFGQGGCDSGP